MSIKEYFKRKFLKGEENVKLLAKQKAQKVKEEMIESKPEEKEETFIKIAAQIAYEQYQQGVRNLPIGQQEEFIREFTKLLMQQPEIPQEVVPEYILEASQKDVIENIVPAIEELPDKQVEEIIFREDSTFSIKEKREIAKTGIANTTLKNKTLEELKKEEQERCDREIKRELRTKYATCDKMRGQRLIDDLQRIKQQTKNSEIENMLTQILARRAAIDCKFLGSTRIKGMTRVLSAEDMLVGNFLKLVEEEFESIKDDDEYKGDRKDFKRIKETLLEQISKEIEIEKQSERQESTQADTEDHTL